MHEITGVSCTQETCESLLKHFDHYIIKQVRYLVKSYPLAVHPAVMDLEIDEIVQRVRIKLWQALKKRCIRVPGAYIRLIIHSELVDMMRRQRPVLPLPIDDEWISDDMRDFIDQQAPDPADEMEQRLEAVISLRKMAQAVMSLPPRQRQAVMCLLRDKVDDVTQLFDVFKLYSVDM